MCHQPSKQIYSDGAIYHNNPIQIADKERKLIWPSLEKDPPDIIVSVGTTYNSTVSTSSEKTPVTRLGLYSHGKSLYKIAVDHIASALDSERTWHSYISVLQPPSSHTIRYVRLNPQLNEDPPGLDEVDQMSYIQDKVRKELRSDNRIRRVALQLIASSFYFERSHPVEFSHDRTVRCKGMQYLFFPPKLAKEGQRIYILPAAARQ